MERGASVRRAIDREMIKEDIVQLFGPGRVVPTLAVLRSAAEIERFEFPLPCVVKPARLCRERLAIDGAQPDRDGRRTLKYWLRRYPVEGGDQAERGKLLVEPPAKTDDLARVYCFHGRPRFIERIARDASDIFDPTGRRLGVEGRRSTSGDAFWDKGALDILRDYGVRLSTGRSFLRIDCVIESDRIVIVEINDQPADAVVGFRPAAADALLARLFDDPALELTPDLVAASLPMGARE